MITVKRYGNNMVRIEDEAPYEQEEGVVEVFITTELDNLIEQLIKIRDGK